MCRTVTRRYARRQAFGEGCHVEDPGEITAQAPGGEALFAIVTYAGPIADRAVIVFHSPAAADEYAGVQGLGDYTVVPIVFGTNPQPPIPRAEVTRAADSGLLRRASMSASERPRRGHRRPDRMC